MSPLSPMTLVPVTLGIENTSGHDLVVYMILEVIIPTCIICDLPIVMSAQYGVISGFQSAV